jgi:KDO2-lipid IV(A) lauroyltransferase
MWRFIHPRYWLQWVAVFILWLISLLPLPVLALLGRGLGRLAIVVAKRRVYIVRRNLELCFPEMSVQQRDQLAREHFMLLGQAVLSVGINLAASKKRLQRLVKVRDRHHYDQALDSGKPVILLAPHFVAMEIGGLVLAPERFMLSMYQAIRNPLIDTLVRKGRSRFGGVMVERKSDLRKVIKLVRAGNPFYYLPDQDPGSGDKVFAPFFGVQTAVTPGLSRLARLSNAVVIPCLSRILPGGKGYEVRFLPAFNDFPTDDPVLDAAYLNRMIEEQVRKMPAQYFWVHRRFKSRPDGEPSLYESKE